MHKVDTIFQLCKSCRKYPANVRCSVPTRATNPTAAPPSPANLRFPFPNTFSFDNQTLSSQDVIDLLAPTLTEHRVARIQQVAKDRTFNVLPIVEGAYDMGNLAAVCRSADGKESCAVSRLDFPRLTYTVCSTALGVGSVHCIVKGDKYKQSARTSAGADKWLHVQVWQDTQSCLQAVKDAGYQVVVTHLSSSSVSIQEIDWTRPTAVVLGNERHGVSVEAIALADATAIIPMNGFVESFNISVAASLVLYEARRQRGERLGQHGDLTQEQQRILTAALMMRTVKDSDSVIRSLIARPPPAYQAHLFRGSTKEFLGS